MHLKPVCRNLLAGALFAALASPALAENQKPLVERIVDAQVALAKGPYEGLRTNHTKGMVVTGSFTPAPTAASVTKAAHLQQTPSQVIVRFSNAGGVPSIADNDPAANPRGIAIRFKLPDGTQTDIVSLSIDRFPVSTPEAFLAFLEARLASGPGTAKPTPVEQLIAATPSLQTFVKLPKPFPRSFASHTYHGINAFVFTNAAGEARYGRYRIEPVAGEAFLSPEEVAGAGPNYLFDELPQRLQQGPVQFRLLLQLAEDGDPLVDPSEVWPAERPLVELGTLSLHASVVDNAAAEKMLAFNPLLLLDGIAPSQDPVLLARPGAYAVSVGRRLNP